ncbi:hypothetical protein [uncultured Dokdonia sp.]|uniref:hypothetical protein n=1 Tax=uncultured Dokdonia sp. TaxID=575653 RepID=UPI00260CDC4F|nr:hypothetical protein [uncultured Dokdonia sp.]
MKFFSIIAILLFTTIQCQPQDYGVLEYYMTLPDLLEENSGIAISQNKKYLYAINDSGGTATIFSIHLDHKEIEQDISISNAQNVDWEDLASFENDLFVGDFGNNDNKRKDQTIYWVENVDQITPGSFSAFAKTTTFTFEDQKEYPPKKGNQNFDVESFFVHNTNFYLFTRNRESHKKFDGITKVYKIPMKEGAQKAILIDEFETCSDRDDCQVTSAAIHHETGKIALLTYNKVWIFDNYYDDQFFSGSVTKIKLGHNSQKESVTFKDAHTLFISEEASSKTQGNVYTLDLKKF